MHDDIRFDWAAIPEHHSAISLCMVNLQVEHNFVITICFVIGSYDGSPFNG